MIRRFAPVKSFSDLSNPKALCSYGPVEAGVSVVILKSGRDWHLLRHQGKPLYVPKWVVG